MTTPVGSGAVDSTPDRGGSLSVDASGYGGADRLEAPDAKQGRQHVPGEAPNTVVLDGPAKMPTRGIRGETRRSERGGERSATPAQPAASSARAQSAAKTETPKS